MTASKTESVVLAAGGTGGHMFPAQALARELLRRGLRPILITDKRAGSFGPDLAEQVETHQIAAAGFAGGDWVSKARSLARLFWGYLQARRLLKRAQPVAVVAFGGYASLPTAMAAAHGKHHLVLHEQNAVAGRANRLLAGRAAAIATSFPEVAGLREADLAKVTVTGNPVRADIAAIGRKPYAVAGSEGPLRLLVTGGSQGARVFNDLIPDALTLLSDSLRARVQVSQQVRVGDMDKVEKLYERNGIRADLQPFFENMPERLQAAHLLICRAGASTITEVAAAGRPAILVPYPFASDDHQTANARAFAEGGGGWLMPQDSLSAEILAERLTELFENPVQLTRAAECARGFAQPDSAARLADLVLGGDRSNGHAKDNGNSSNKEAAA